MEDNTVYDLSEDEYYECLANAELLIFEQGERVEKPRSIFAVAQPGAGKTLLRAYLVNEAQNAGTFSKFIEFNPDVIALCHKHYREIIKDFPDESYKILQRFTGRALDTYLRSRAVDLRFNIMQEGTFASTDAYIGIINAQKNGGTLETVSPDDKGKKIIKEVQGGYDVDVNVLAVNRFESLLSCFEREENFVENGLPPRAVTIESHDYAYKKILETVDKIEQKHLYDRIRVFKRGYVAERPELVYAAGDNRFPCVREAIAYERKKQEIDLFKNPRPFWDRIESLKERLAVNANNSLSKRLETFEEMFLNELGERGRVEDVRQ